MAAQAKAGDIRAGGSFYEIYLKDGVSGVLDKVKSKVLGFASFLQRTGANLALGGAALGAGPLAAVLGGSNTRPVEMTYALDQMKAAWMMAFMQMQRAMVPVVEGLVPIVTSIADFARENAGLVRTIAYVAGGMFLAGKAIFLVGTAITVATAAATLFTKAMVLAASTPALIVAAVAVMTAAIVASTDRGQKGFLELRDTGLTAWEGIVAAVKSGDLVSAFEIIGLALRLEWKKVVLYWTEVFEDFTSFFRNTWEDVVNWFRIKMGDVSDFFSDTFDDIKDWFSEQFGGAKTARAPSVGDIARQQVAAEDAARKARQAAERAAAIAPIQAEIEKAKRDLDGKVRQVVAAAAAPADEYGAYHRVAQATRGAFNVASAGQQLGIHESSKMLEYVKDIDEKVKVLPQAIAAAFAAAIQTR